jgi:hypothetical protein
MKLPTITFRDVLIALALGAVVFLFIQWRDSHDAQIQLKSTVAAQQQVIDQAKAQQADLQKQMAQRDQATAQTIQEMQSEVQKLQSAQQIAAYLEATVNKSAPAPITITAPGNAQSPVVAQIPQGDMTAIRDLVANCQACEVQLPACEKDKADLSAQLTAAGEQLSATEKQRDAAIKAAKGGSFWHRTGVALKWIAIGGLIGYGAAYGGL